LTEWSVARHPNVAFLDWSPDGTSVLVSGFDPNVEVHIQLWLVDIEDGDVERWFTGDSNYSDGHFSPDGRWVAYRSDETGVSEIYIRPFPGPGAPLRVSTAGGGEPSWRADGRELFYLTLDGALASVDVDYEDGLAVSPPQELIPLVNRSPFGESTRYDATPDGERFLILRDTNAPVELVQGWTDLLPN
jgi:dipeptidyl aminopeptidase/acylaminoacyl peptidase